MSGPGREDTMKEYRIVCTVDTVHSDGRKYHRENTAPWIAPSMLPHRAVYATKADAAKALREIVKRAREFDKITQERARAGERDTVEYRQSDIRVQSRTVTNWEG